MRTERPPQPLPISPQAMADLMCTMIVLCRGVDALRRPIWAYLCMKPSMAVPFREARARGGFDISEFGTVLESGEGDWPLEALMRRMERDYAVNHRLEDEWIAAMETGEVADS